MIRHNGHNCTRAPQSETQPKSYLYSSHINAMCHHLAILQTIITDAIFVIINVVVVIVVINDIVVVLIPR